LWSAEGCWLGKSKKTKKLKSKEDKKKINTVATSQGITTSDRWTK